MFPPIALPFRCLLVTGVCLVAFASPNPGQTETHEAKKQSATRHDDPKCSFLRHEFGRIKKEGEASVESSPIAGVSRISDVAQTGKSVSELADYVADAEVNAARLTILSLDIQICDAGQALSSTDRLPALETSRQKQISRAQSRWERLGGSRDDEMCHGITSHVNRVYDDEAKSFYNSDAAHSSMDPDIIKEYPTLISLVEQSSLPQEQKPFFVQNARYLRFEEAGRLFNILKGIDKDGSLSYAYSLRKVLSERAQQESLIAHAESATAAARVSREIGEIMTWILIVALTLGLAFVGWTLFRQSKKYAKYKAIQSGQLRVPYWWGSKELILWEPGEAVVLLRNKKLVAMADASGGYDSISAWSGEEYKGRITYKSQMQKYTSDGIHTSEGISVNLVLGILWHIENPNTYISRIAADYHVEDRHVGKPRGHSEMPTGEEYFDEKLKETAEKWIRVLAGSSLRDHICQLTAGNLISPYVQSYVHRYFNLGGGETQENKTRMPTLLVETQVALNEKTRDYGIRIERLEVIELKLPFSLQEKLETVRVSFLEPAKSSAETEARNIEKKGLNQVQLDALNGLAEIIGKDNVARIEFMKAIGLAKIPFVAPYAPPFSVLQSFLANQRPGMGSDPLEGQDTRFTPAEEIVGEILRETKPADANPEKPKADAAGST